MSDPERDAFIEQMTARFRQLLGECLADDPVTLDEIEARVEEIGQTLETELERGLLDRHEQPAVPADNQTACPEYSGPAPAAATPPATGPANPAS